MTTNLNNDNETDELLELLKDAEKDFEEDFEPVASKPRPALQDDDSFSAYMDSAATSTATPTTLAATSNNTKCSNKISSLVQSSIDPLDSSDDEDISNFLERKYNEYGRDVRSVLKKQNEEKTDRKVTHEVNRSLTAGNPVRQRSAGLANTKHEFPKFQLNDALAPKSITSTAVLNSMQDIGIYTDPIFGLRIVHPLISSTVMQERMVGRKAIAISNLKNHLAHGDLTQDWAIGGVLVQKGVIMNSKKGHQYAIWKISDLKNDIKTISVFLFKNACKELWKTAQGMAVAILNPGTMKNQDKNDEVSVSVDNPQKFMILGQSKDLGVCKSKKKNGEPCTATVNKYVCEYCIYHVKQEYGKMSGRTELQSSTSGRGLQNLRNKVLGKNEVFYGGQSFTAIPAKKNPKLVEKDQKRLMTLSEYYQSPFQNGTSPLSSTTRTSAPTRATSKSAMGIESNIQQRQKDLDRLKHLSTGDSSKDTTTNQLPATAATSSHLNNSQPKIPAQFQNRQFKMGERPTLSQKEFSFEMTISQRQSDFAKSKALEVLKKKPIEKSNPNFIKYRGTEKGKKRALDELQSQDENQIKKQKLTEAAEKFQKERIEAIINAKSSHTELIEAHENDMQEKYFNKLEKKEAMEEKMLSTYKMDCKAVVCLKCRYTAFSASDMCKEERHPIKVIDAVKRFFECSDCGNRTATVHRMPQMSCKNCQSSRWQRTAMIKDRKNDRIGEKLSIRGDEETFLGSLQSSGNVNLCVAVD